MRILVLGAGVVGVATAYYLARAGHDVEVLERRMDAGMETSFANAGQVSPGYSTPWAGPGIPLRALRWLVEGQGPLFIRAWLDPAMLPWLFRMLRHCTSQRFAENKARMLAIATYSRDCLRDLRNATGLDYDHAALGTLQLFRSQREFDSISADLDVLRTSGIAHNVLDRQSCVALEPALGRARADVAGGLHIPDDETGDCRMFTQRLARIAETLGVRFRYGVKIKKIIPDGGRVNSVMTSHGRYNADAYVVAMGSHTPRLLQPLGIRMPIYPVKGYSLTLPITDPAAAPRSTVMDERNKVAVTRLGDRLRIGGIAELAGYDLALRPERRTLLERVVADLFPDAGNVRHAEFWCGLRAMTPDGPPLVGQAGLDGLFVNSGHGTLGWTMACGTAKMLADMISRRATDIDAQDFSIARYPA